MQANLFKLFAIAAAFSAVHSAPVETAEVAEAKVNGTQTDDSVNAAGVRALPPAFAKKTLISCFPSLLQKTNTKPPVKMQ